MNLISALHFATMYYHRYAFATESLVVNYRQRDGHIIGPKTCVFLTFLKFYLCLTVAPKRNVIWLKYAKSIKTSIQKLWLQVHKGYPLDR